MRWFHFGFIALAFVANSSPRATLSAQDVSAQDAPPLKLIQRIELSDIHSGEPEVSAEQLAKNLTTTRMPGVQNHFDHLTPDLKGHRLFVVPEDNKSIEVYDLRSGKFIHSIKGIGVGHCKVPSGSFRAASVATWLLPAASLPEVPSDSAAKFKCCHLAEYRSVANGLLNGGWVVTGTLSIIPGRRSVIQ